MKYCYNNITSLSRMSQKDRRTVLKQSGAVITGLTGLSQTVAADSDGEVESNTRSWPITLNECGYDRYVVFDDCPTINKGTTYTFKNLEFELTYGDLQLTFWGDGAIKYHVKTVEYDRTYNVDAPADIPHGDSYVGVEAAGDNAEITYLTGKIQPIWMD
jgi:hypothetical protein